MNKLLQQLEEFNSQMQRVNAQFALIGEMALSAHQVPRATLDIDFLLAKSDAELAHRILLSLGYRCIHRSDNAANYLRGAQAVDFIYAFRPRALALLTQAKPCELGSQFVRVVSVEGLIGLKLQAVSNDPSRKQDLLDIEKLFAKHRSTINHAELKDYFQLFQKDDLYAELLNEFPPS